MGRSFGFFYFPGAKRDRSDQRTDGLGLEIVLQARRAVLITPAGLLVAALGQFRREIGMAVDPDRAGADPGCGAVSGREVAGPDAGREPVWRIVGEGEGFLDIVERRDGDYWPEDLFAHH